jgi:uncharacterized protein
MNLSKVERTILINQYEILKKLEPESPFNKRYDAYQNILISGYTPLYHEFLNLEEEEENQEQIYEEMNQILNMFRNIKKSIDKLSEDDKKRLDLYKLEFHGFDGNNDIQYGYLMDMAKLDRWAEFAHINSHNILSLDKYQSLLQNYKKLGMEKRYYEDMTLEELLSL